MLPVYSTGEDDTNDSLQGISVNLPSTSELTIQILCEAQVGLLIAEILRRQEEVRVLTSENDSMRDSLKDIAEISER